MMSKDATPVAESVDRKAAQDCLNHAFRNADIGGHIDFDDIIGHFARHRLAAYEAGRAEGVREAAEVADRYDSDGYDTGDDAKYCIALGIRALSKEPTK